MAGFYYHLDNKEVIRIKAKKLDGNASPVYKKFSVDPQVTSFEMLKSNLARAFEITSDFTISYISHNYKGQQVYISMMSDWDMDAAFQCAADPYLKLRVDLRPFEELDDWDVIAPAEIPQHEVPGPFDKTSLLGSITGTITQNLGKTVVSVQRAMGFKRSDSEFIKPTKAHMSEMEFRNYQDSSGFMIKPYEFRLSVYQGGIEPSLRRVAWRHLLNIYPIHMSSRDRFVYLERKEKEYQKLRDSWRSQLDDDTAMDEVKNVVCMVKKDVLRTDRSLDFFAGNDENANTLSLCHILVTYALTHPDVSYCQGMSDLASPLLVTQKNEGHAYICFCALMNRLRENFTAEGNAIMTKFRHLSELLCMYDPDLYNHFLQNSSGEMFFCYRWFLLELKREFPFNDALSVLEVMWATLPINHSECELSLVDPDYSSKLLSTSSYSPATSLQQVTYTRLLAMRQLGSLYQSTKPITSPSPRASANNNLSTEQSTQYGSSSIYTSMEAGKDKSTNCSKVDNSNKSYYVQKSNNMDTSHQLEQLCQKSSCNDNVDNNNEDDSESAVFGCHGDIVSNDIFWAFTDSYYSSNTRSNALDFEHCNRCSRLMDLDHGMLNSGFHSSSDPDTGITSWSLNSIASESSGSYQLDTQFILSLDSNTDNSENSSGTAAELKNFISSTGSSEAEPEKNNMRNINSGVNNIDFSRKETSRDIFQSRKQLLTAPKHQSLSRTCNNAGSLPSSVSKKPLSPASEQFHLNLVMSAGTELSKNFSDFKISECQEATEDFGNSETTSLTNTTVRDLSKLPPPHELGAGNPFLMFLCLTLLVQHRETILSQEMCYEEIAMYFDRRVRRHNANRVLHFAREMYTEYLRAQHKRFESEADEELGLSC